MGGDVGDQHRGRRAGDRADVVVLGVPDAPVAEPLRRLRERDRALEAVGDRLVRPDRGEVEDREGDVGARGRVGEVGRSSCPKHGGPAPAARRPAEGGPLTRCARRGGRRGRSAARPSSPGLHLVRVGNSWAGHSLRRRPAATAATRRARSRRHLPRPRVGPFVDARVEVDDPVDLGQFLGGEVEVVERVDVLLQLLAEEAPITSEVIRGSRRLQASAICGSDWPRFSASAASSRTRPITSSLIQLDVEGAVALLRRARALRDRRRCICRSAGPGRGR